MKHVYENYVAWCNRLQIAPCSLEAYERELQNVRGDAEGFVKFGTNIATYKQKPRNVRRGTWVTIGALSEMILGIRDIQAMEHKLTQINLHDATKAHTVDGETFTLFDVRKIMNRLGKITAPEPEPQVPTTFGPEPEPEVVSLLSNAALDQIVTETEPDFAEAAA